MSSIDYDDPAVEARWCAERRAEVADYLREEGVVHGQIGEWPAWHAAPHVSIWAIESRRRPGWVGWWVVCGDLPTDYISAGTIRHPRDALRAIGERWFEVAGSMRRGEERPDVTFGPPEERENLAPLLEARAALFAALCDDAANWTE